MDLGVLKGKDPMGLETEQLLKSGIKYTPTSKELRIFNKQQQRNNNKNEQRPFYPVSVNDPRANRNKRSEIEKFKQVQVDKIEREIDRVHEEKLKEKNLPIIKKREKNREKRLRKKVNRKQ